MKQPSKHMKQAMDLALKAYGQTWPNPMVGAVLVKNGKVIGQGWHKHAGGDHAEIDAIKKAGLKAKGATLYVTLEPCSHFGRTPPCTEAIIKAGIHEVVVGSSDPNPLTHGKAVRILSKAGIKVMQGDMEHELTRMNEVFNKYITTRRPFTVAKCAQTLDGKIATATGDSKWITSEATRTYARKRRNDFDAIMVGINTVLMDDPQLTAANKKKHIKKIVVDSGLQIPLKAKLFQDTQPGDVIIATTKKADPKKIQQFASRGIKVLMISTTGKHQHVNLKELFKELGKMEISHLLIEGGGRLIGRALKDGLVDRMMVYIAPKIIGDQAAVSSIAGLNVAKIGQALELREMTVKMIGMDILIEGYISGSNEIS